MQMELGNVGHSIFPKEFSSAHSEIPFNPWTGWDKPLFCYSSDCQIHHYIGNQPLSMDGLNKVVVSYVM